MPVVINQFEAVAEPPPAGSTAPGPGATPTPKIEAQALHRPLRAIARRHDRLRAH